MLVHTGCVLLQNGSSKPELQRWPGGVVTQVEAEESFLIFEGSHNFPVGQELRVMRNGKPVGVVRVRQERQKRFHSADILQGDAAPGDVVEAPLPLPRPEEAEDR